jgi:aryl-alcohol dehydrogenase-like predicted oxidoreductase
MLTRQLGSSPLHVTELSLGSWLTYAGGINRRQSERCIDAAFQHGIRSFDTANVYGFGVSEKLLGEALASHPRDSFVLATKVFFPMPVKRFGLPTRKEQGGLSAAQIELQLNASLKRLRTDYVDIYYCHRFDSHTPLEETMAALTRAVQSGKVRYLGLSEWTPEQMDQAAALAATGKHSPFVASQPQYSMLIRKAEPGIFPAGLRHGIGQIVFSPLAQGVLSGKYKPGTPPPPDSRAAHKEMNRFMTTAGRRFRDDDLLAAVQQLTPLAADHSLTLSQLALAWVLHRPEVASALIGATSPEQIAENAKASGLTLANDTLARIDEILAPVVVNA